MPASASCCSQLEEAECCCCKVAAPTDSLHNMVQQPCLDFERHALLALLAPAAGITRNFILNGLDHCRHLLDTSLPSPAKLPTPSLKTSDFEYFCLYNNDLGRHEAYYQATTDTVLKLPAAVAAPVAAGISSTARARTASDSVGAAAGSSEGVVEVPVAAGELISVEFSYKYSQQEVQQLASGAGLQRVKAWSDARQRYDLHLLQRRE